MVGLIEQLDNVINALKNIRLPAQELTASTEIMRQVLALNGICKKLEEEAGHDEADNQ
jgi:hypothetical protein